jgi:hypothetical protein
MLFVSPRVHALSDLPVIHAGNALYALAEIQRCRGGLVAAGVLWGRVVWVGEVVLVGRGCVLEVGVVVGRSSGPRAFRTVKVWDEAVDVFGPSLVRDFYGLFVGEWRALIGRDGCLRHWLDLWGVYGASDDPRRLGRPLGGSQDVVGVSVVAEE